MPAPETLAFDIQFYDGTRQTAISGMSDIRRLRVRYPGADLDDENQQMEYLFYLAWLAARRDDTRPRLDYDEWADTVRWMETEKIPLVPFDVAPQNGSPPNWHLPPTAPAPTPWDGSTPTPVSP